MIYRKEPRQILLFDRVEEILHPKAHLNIEVDKQRLDSTHIFSNMADWNRSMLLFKTRKRFLVQVKRHESRLYGELDQDLQEDYEAQSCWIYGDAKARNARYGNHICSNHEQLGWDMLRLIERFEKHPKLSNMNTFKDMVRIFGKQCEIDDGKVKIREHPDGKALVNPSDPDASIDNKGVGYQVQVSETYNPENPVQIITAAFPQTASKSDQNAVTTMLEKMEKAGAKPEILLADSGYGSDEYDARSLRLRERRLHEKTEEFREDYPDALRRGSIVRKT